MFRWAKKAYCLFASMSAIKHDETQNRSFLQWNTLASDFYNYKISTITQLLLS